MNLSAQDKTSFIIGRILRQKKNADQDKIENLLAEYNLDDIATINTINTVSDEILAKDINVEEAKNDGIQQQNQLLENFKTITNSFAQNMEDIVLNQREGITQISTTLSNTSNRDRKERVLRDFPKYSKEKLKSDSILWFKQFQEMLNRENIMDFKHAFTQVVDYDTNIWYSELDDNETDTLESLKDAFFRFSKAQTLRDCIIKYETWELRNLSPNDYYIELKKLREMISARDYDTNDL